MTSTTCTYVTSDRHVEYNDFMFIYYSFLTDSSLRTILYNNAECIKQLSKNLKYAMKFRSFKDKILRRNPKTIAINEVFILDKLINKYAVPKCEVNNHKNTIMEFDGNKWNEVENKVYNETNENVFNIKLNSDAYTYIKFY